jgi:iron complex outermembrane receptor protein
MQRFLFTSLFFWQAVILSAQSPKGITDSVFRIREVTVTSNRLAYFSVGNKIKTIDSSLLGSYSTSYLSQILGSYSQVQINSYGLGLSNPSIRGTGSSHTAVLWNGFNLQDLLNGGVDCALLPINFFDDVKVQYGGCSALYGSGAIGGAIHLINNLDFNKGFNASLTSGYGSFENIYGGWNLGYSSNRYSGFIRSFYNTAQNDFNFKFSSKPDARTGTMMNANSKQYGILAGNAFKLTNHSKIESFLWFQDNNKDIAPTLLTYGSGKYDNQRDKFYRAMASWKTWTELSDLTIRSFFSDYYTVWDSLRYRSVQLSNQAEYNLRINKNNMFNAGVDYTFEKGFAKSFITNPHRDRISLFTSYRFTGSDSRLQVAANIRDEMIDNVVKPVTFSVGFEYPVYREFMLKGNVSKNYRVPTFNDLYWFPGGNPDLRNESGFNEEVGFVFAPKWELFSIRYESTAFSNLVSDWILWQPSLNDANLWTAENVNKVWARGVENDFSVSFPLNEFLIKTSVSYTYTRSTKEKADAPGDRTYHKQLIYVPEHKGMASLSVRYSGFTFYVAQSFTGLRYATQDNALSVDPYTLSNLSISKIFRYQNHQINGSFQINNLWNNVYQVIPNYPMPLRNFQLNIQLKL